MAALYRFCSCDALDVEYALSDLGDATSPVARLTVDLDVQRQGIEVMAFPVARKFIQVYRFRSLVATWPVSPKAILHQQKCTQ